METINVYRKLLRTVKLHITKDPSKSSLKDYIVQEFKKNVHLTDKDAIKTNLQLASDYAMLVQSVHHHKELLFSYNIAVDRSEEQKARMKNTAERVGLQLPKVECEESEK